MYLFVILKQNLDKYTDKSKDKRLWSDQKLTEFYEKYLKNNEVDFI